MSYYPGGVLVWHTPMLPELKLKIRLLRGDKVTRTPILFRATELRHQLRHIPTVKQSVSLFLLRLLVRMWFPFTRATVSCTS